MRFEPIPGFSALQFKEETQARVQEELAGLTAEEKRRKLRESIRSGPLGDWWDRVCAEKRAEAKAALERQELEDAA